MPNTGSDTSSTASTRTKLAKHLPRNKAEAGMGAAMSASRQSLGNSRAKLRFKVRVPAKANTIHNRPPETSRIISCDGSKVRSEEHTSELQSPCNLVCRLLLEKKKIKSTTRTPTHLTRQDRHY